LPDQTSSLEDNISTLKSAYAALNRNDPSGFVASFDPQMEWMEFLESPAGGTYTGIEAVRAHVEQAREQWAEGSCEPERFIPTGDKIVVFVNVRVRLKNERDWREGQLADVYTFRQGKAIQARVFADRQQALTWAGARLADQQ
jgi:ketosteroid isomerase-like protein